MFDYPRMKFIIHPICPPPNELCSYLSCESKRPMWRTHCALPLRVLTCHSSIYMGSRIS
uniref:Uncharacterized protein n=1 Tax=Arundo donax TaxID=35708 RepID=A0A0A9CW62_ARUDO